MSFVRLGSYKPMTFRSWVVDNKYASFLGLVYGCIMNVCQGHSTLVSIFIDKSFKYSKE